MKVPKEVSNQYHKKYMPASKGKRKKMMAEMHKRSAAQMKRKKIMGYNWSAFK